MDLVCIEDFKIGLFGSLFFMGLWLSSAFLVRLADIIGRRIVVLIGLIGMIIWSILIFFVNLLTIVYLITLITGMFHALRLFPGYILSMELMLPSYRKSFHTTIQIIDKIDAIFIPIFVYFVGNAKDVIYLIIGFWSISAFMVYITPDSPEYLYANGKWKQLHTAFQYICRFESTRWKNFKFDKERNLSIAEVEKKVSLIEALKDSKTRRNLIIMCINWSTWVFWNYTLLFYSQYFKGSMYVNLLILGVADVLAKITARVLQSYLETRRIYMIWYSVIFFFSILYNFISEKETYVAVTILLLKWGVTINFGLCYYGNKEYFHPDFTSTAFGIWNIWARSLTIAAPMLAEVLEKPIILITISTLI